MHKASAACRRCESFPLNKSTLTPHFSMKYLENRSTPSIPCSPRRINSPISTSSPHPKCSFKNPLITTSHKSSGSIFGSSSNAGLTLKAANLSFPEPIGIFSGKHWTISSNLLINLLPVFCIPRDGAGRPCSAPTCDRDDDSWQEAILTRVGWMWSEAHIMAGPASHTVDGTGMAFSFKNDSRDPSFIFFASVPFDLCFVTWFPSLVLFIQVLDSPCTTVDCHSTIGACCESLWIYFDPL